MNKKILSGIVVVILIVIGAVYYNQSSKGAGSVTIGIMAPLSGDYAVAGENYQKGILLAEELYEKVHPDLKVNIVIEDDAFNANKGVTAYKKVTSVDHVNAIVMLSTPVIDAIYPDVVKTDIPVMQLGIQTKGLGKDNIFQTSPLPEAPIENFAKYINANYKLNKVAVLYDNTAGGLSFYEAFKKTYSGAYDGLVINGKDDLRNYATKITTNNYDGVLFLTSPENGALMVKNILTLSPSKHPFFMFDAQLQTGFADYQRILGSTKVLDGSISIWLESGDADTFKEEYKKKYGSEPGFLADFGYDTFNTLINAYDEEGKTWQKNIQKTKTDGASGSMSFDENGVRIQDIVVNKVVDGEITPISAL
jgi:branched-chain amino acid transport system substrate-binding protein